MGQQNQKIKLQEFQETNEYQKRRKIFKHEFKTNAFNQSQKCVLPNCQCPSRHSSPQNFKICSVCLSLNQGKGFKKMKIHDYNKESLSLKQPKKVGFSSYPYSEQKVINQQAPTHYYNAWSLPIQPCFSQKISHSRALTAQNQERLSSVSVKPIRKIPQQPTFILDNIIKDQSRIIDVEKIPDFKDIQDRNRRQKLFMF